MRIIGLLTLCLFLLTSFAWGQQATFDKECTAIVQGHTALFTFILPRRQTWTWNMKETPDNYQEYSWEITLEGGTATPKYKFGVYIFKFPSAQEEKGSINQLIADTQTSVWDQSLRIREDLIIQSNVEDNKLILRISDKKTFSELFSQKPMIAHYRVRTPYTDINYVGKTQIESID